MRSWRGSSAVVRGWHIVTVIVIVAALGTQLGLVIDGGNVLVPEGETLAPTPLRIANFFSYFTVQSNILLAIGAWTLARNPDRDGPLWRVVRAAGLIGITVTGIVYVTLLRPIVELDGLAQLTNIGFHYLSPVLGVLGWLLFGPHPRLDRASMLWSLAWPLGWLGYTLVRGVIRDWYPYPFIDVIQLGYGRTLLNALGVTVLMLTVGALLVLLDRRFLTVPSGPEEARSR